MQVMETTSHAQPIGLHTAVRNRYYFGKLLDVVHFDIEQDYFNYKRWLINRLILGYGVVCGFDVELGKDETTVSMTSGFGIDRWGREIIAPAGYQDFKLPDRPAAGQQQSQQQQKDYCEDDDVWYHLLICYYECDGSPEPALGDECGVETCVPSLAQERFKLEWRKGRAPEPPHDDCPSDLITGDRVNRRALAIHISQCCQKPPCDPCLPLANVRIPPEGQGSIDIDITIRPIVYTNDLLYQLITAMGPRPNHARAGK